jgi:pimeloyl-ACP methyl ester carboxylesterase
MNKITIPKSRILYLIITLFMVACTPYQNATKISSFDDLEYPFQIDKIQVSEKIEIAYIDEGKGQETILFIHGLGSYLPAWKRNIEELKKHYRCIAIDLPGYGKSSKIPHSGQMTFYASVVNDFVKAMKLEKVILAGHSMGGQISMITAMQYPEITKKLILVDPAGFERFHEGQKEWFREVMTVSLVKATNADGIQTNLAHNFYDLPEEAKFMISDRLKMRTALDFDYYCHAVVQSVHGMVNQPVIDKLDKIKQPTLIFFGENDNLIPNRYLNPGRTVKIAEYGASKISNSKLIMVPKCGHFMMFEKPDIFNSGVIDFLN